MYHWFNEIHNLGAFLSIHAPFINHSDRTLKTHVFGIKVDFFLVCRKMDGALLRCVYIYLVSGPVVGACAQVMLYSSILLNLTICNDILLLIFGVAHVRFNAIL